MRRALQKWQIVNFAAIAIATVFISILAFKGTNEASFRILIRLTARSSAVLFLLAFTASPLQRLKPSNLSNWMLRNRRYFGLSMAISHGFHAVAIAGVAVLTSESMVGRDSLDASLGYVFIFLMTITSFPYPAAILGRRNWKVLHTVGMYYLWLSFTVAFGSRIAEAWLFYLPVTVILIATLMLRVALLVKMRRT